MNRHTFVFQNAFTPAQCDVLIAYATRHAQGRPGTVGYGAKTVVREELRRSQVRWLRRHDDELRSLYAVIDTLIHKANREAFGFDLAGYSDVQFTEYDAAVQGTYGWHEDAPWLGPKPFMRKLSLVAQLTDPARYDGGALEVQPDTPDVQSDLQRFRAQGSVILFPSFLRHRVIPVTRGRRYSLVTWIEGPRWR